MNTTTKTETFTLQFRDLVSAECGHGLQFSTMDAAIMGGLSTGKAFDISAPSGAIVWAWEMRRAAR